MEKKQYVHPAIKQVFMEDLMDLGVHNSVGSGKQLGNDAIFEEDEQEDCESSLGIWN